MEKENKNLKSLHTETLKQNEAIFFQISERDKEIDELRKKFQADENELEKGKKLKKLHEDALRQNDGLLIRIEEKDKEIAELEKRLQEEHGRSKKTKDHEKAIEEHRANITSLDSENKRLKKLHEDALKHSEGHLAQLREKEKAIAEAEKRLEEIETLKSEKEKAVANMEALRSKLYISTKELKEQAGRITQLEETLKHRDKRLGDSDKAYKILRG